MHAITRSIDEVDELVRELAIDDVVSTLENGHPLNRLITTPEGELVGYIACEDFMPHEAYIKYFGTTGSSGRSLLKEIPAFIQYARQQGYTKLNFHGWNNRLNHILERYGFQRIRTDAAAGFNVDYFELPLVEQKTSDQVAQERTAAFENKYLQRIQKDYQETLATFSTNVRQYKEHELVDVFLGVSAVLSSTNGFEFGERQRAILKLKLARHFQREDTIDTNTLIDALIESPKFINTDKGSLHRLFEVHQEKTLQKIAEMRKRQAEITGDKKINPYEALFTTTSGQYYMARLLNMPHLEAESAYMNHCVGLSDSYINQMKRGDIEILSFRRAPIVDPHPYNQRLRGDVPVITIEYNLRTNVIEQMKKENDELLRTDDPFYADVIDALHQLRTTATDTGKLRDFKEIASSELSEIPVSDYHLLTEQGDVAARDYDPIVHGFIIKKGDLTLRPEFSPEDVATIVNIHTGLDLTPEQIARGKDQITSATKLYIGPLFEGIFKLPIEHLYTAFPERKIEPMGTDIGDLSAQELEREMKSQGINIDNAARSFLESNDFTISKTREHVDLVRLTVADLGLPRGATTEEIYRTAESLGLELCPAEVGPHLRLAYQGFEWMFIAMKPITDSDGESFVFHLYRYDGGPELTMAFAKPTDEWAHHYRFVFRIRN